MFWYALVLGFLASSVLPWFSSDKELGAKISWTISSLIGNILLALITSYFGMPVATGPMGGFLNLWGVVMVNFIAGFIFWMVDSNSEHHMMGIIGSGVVLALMVLILGANGLNGWVNRDRERFRFANIETKPIEQMPWDNDNPKPILTEGNAKSLFSSALPQATSTGRPIVGRYKIGDVVKQEINGHLYWIGMLTYNSDFAGAFDDSVKTVPGYLMADAESAKSTAKFIEYNINYFDGAFFGHDINRLLYYSGFSSYKLIDPTVEVSDEDGKLYETVGLAKYNFSVFHYRVEKIAIVDVTTGMVVQLCDLGSCPAWVDRQIDDVLANEAVTWFGLYVKDDWWNPSKRDTFKADDAPVFTYSPTNGKEFQLLMTSTSTSDNTSTGIIYYKTDEMKGVFYQVSGDPFPLGNQVVTKIQQNATISVSKYMVDQVLQVNISGHPSWLATLSIDNPPFGTQFQGVAYVLATSSPDVTSVDVQFDKDPAVAQAKYLAWLKQYFNKEKGSKTGTVTELGTYIKDGNSVFSMTIRDDKTGQLVSAVDPVSGIRQPVFFTVVVSDNTREITMTKPGDHVAVEYYTANWNEYVVTKLENSDRPSLTDNISNTVNAMMSALFGK